MSLLPLPPDAPIGGGELPVTSVDDVLLVVPAFLKPSDPSPLRDAILEALTVMMRKYQINAEESTGMADVLRSLDSALVGLGEDRGVFKSKDETNEQFRQRILRIPSLVTPEAIIVAVNKILEPHTSIQAQYSESIQDRWYIGSGDKGWHSFVFDEETSLSPNYPERLYEDDEASNLGYVRPNSNPGGARVYSDTIGRLFTIRIPDIEGVENLGAFPGTVGKRFYIGGVGVSAPIRSNATSLKDTLNLIISAIERLKGHSIRYILIMDSKLK